MILQIYGELQVPYDVVPSLFETDIHNHLPTLSANLASRALIGYYNPALKSKYPVKNELIDVILRDIDSLDFNEN